MSFLDFPADVQQFLRQEVASGKFPSEAEVVVAALRRYRDSDACSTGELVDHEPDVLNWDDLIPVPPDRPGGPLPVRFAMAGRDKPLPADDPWVK
jgi:hypothetical protein